MSIKYKMVQRAVTPGTKASEKKWYATSKSEAPLSVRKLSEQATANTTLSAVELEAALRLLGDYLPKQLLQGHTVPIPGLGYFRLTFKSKGVDSVKAFKAGEMIYGVRPIFTIGKELREAIKKEVEFEDGGVKVGNVNYATRSDYYEATGQVSSGGSSDEEEETPGGGSTQPGGQGGSGGTGSSGEE